MWISAKLAVIGSPMIILKMTPTLSCKYYVPVERTGHERNYNQTYFFFKIETKQVLYYCNIMYIPTYNYEQE